MFESLEKLLPKSLTRNGAAQKVEAAIIISKTGAVLLDIFGAEAAMHMKPAGYRTGELIIDCDRSVYGEQVVLREQDLIEGLNKMLGPRTVRRVRVRS